MNERPTDYELLQAFVRHSDQEAFAAVVRRHLDLVFATALRKLGESGAAEEVAQNVFAALACKAWQFSSDDSVPAWLYRTTLLETKEWWRGELRRRRREQTAAELGTTMNASHEHTPSRALLPLLDEALLSLRETDRTALLLRFYEGRSLREVGVALAVGEDAAQKRVSSALEKLAAFFQRRGYKTATAAATASALQHTAASASAATASTVITVALRAAPPALAGWAVPLARLGSLSKIQTAALCAALVAVPVAWQLHRHQAVRAEAVQTEAQLASVQTEQTTLRAEVERLRADSKRLTESIAQENSAADRAVASAKTFADWRARLLAELTGGNYHWPTDSPFVRIPKSAIPKIQPDQTVMPPGVLSQEARELLGLTPRKREQIENALHTYFSTMDSMINARVLVTNQAPGISAPKDALASEMWVVPALGGQLKASSDELETSLQNILGPERWALVKDQLQSNGTDTLRRILGLDASQNPQSIAVWITEKNGKYFAAFGWSGLYASFSTGRTPLAVFLPDASAASGGRTAEDILGSLSLPGALIGPMKDWIQQEAGNYLGKGAGQ